MHVSPSPIDYKQTLCGTRAQPLGCAPLACPRWVLGWLSRHAGSLQQLHAYRRPWGCQPYTTHVHAPLWLSPAVLTRIHTGTGFAAAGLFRVPRGPKAAAIAGGVGGVAAAGLAGLRTYFPSL